MASVKKYILPQGFTYTFHSGFMKTPENSVEGLEKAFEMNAEIVEVDVTFRNDGTPVIIHLDSADDDKGELFDDAMAAVAKNKNCRVNLDIKSVANLPAVDEIIKKYNLDQRAFYTGVWEKWVENVRADSSLPYYLNYNVTALDGASPESVKKLADKIKDLGACGLNTNFMFVNKTIVKGLHEAGIPVSAWTCNTKRDMKKMLALGVDNITTKRPDKLRTLI